MSSILVVDDEAGIRELLSEILEDEGYRVHLAENASQARDLRHRERPDLVLLDIWMPDTDGVTLLREWKAHGLLTMPVVMMSGHGTIDTAVEATKIGALDFLEKPITLQKLLSAVERALKRGEIQFTPGIDLSRLGKSPVIAALRQRLLQLAHFKAPLLLLAERGAGAELCARFLHQPNTPWRQLDDPALLVSDTQELAESLRDGLLFVPAVDTLKRLEQKGLLLLINKAGRYNFRVVGASSQPLFPLVESKAFDADLHQALSGISLTVPPLREHREDIPELAAAMLEQLVENRLCPMRGFSTAALNLLRNEDWPGNLPQLESAVKTLALTALGEEIGTEDVQRVLRREPAENTARESFSLPLDLPLREARELFERAYFEHHIGKSGGNMSRVAERVGLERTHLYRKLKQLGIRFSRRGEVD
jgi:DNA-binding NtrC family response regulator